MKFLENPNHPDNDAIRELRDEIKDFNKHTKEYSKQSSKQTGQMIVLTWFIAILTLVMAFLTLVTAFFAYEQYLVAKDTLERNKRDAYKFCTNNPNGKWPVIGGGLIGCLEVLEKLQKSRPELLE